MIESDRLLNRAISDNLDLALRHTNVFPAVVDLETGEIAGQSLWDEVVGNPPGTTTARLSAWEAAINPGDRPARDASWADCLGGRAPLYEAEYQVRRYDGGWVWVRVVGKVVERDATGRPLRLVLAVGNVDDLKHAEQALGERERQLDSLLGHLPGLAYRALADDHWSALFASKGVEELTGYPAVEFTSHRLNYGDIILAEDRPATREAVLTALRERKMYEDEHRVRHKDGSVRWIWARPRRFRPGRLVALHRGLEPGYDPPKAGGGRVAARQGGRGIGEPSQGRVPRQRQPRDPNSHECHPGHDGAGAWRRP